MPAPEAEPLSVEEIVRRAKDIVAIQRGRRRTVKRLGGQHPEVRGVAAHMFTGHRVRVTLKYGEIHTGKVVTVGTLWNGSYGPGLVLHVAEGKWDRIFSTATIESIEELA